jgi:hypothetical protein
MSMFRLALERHAERHHLAIGTGSLCASGLWSDAGTDYADWFAKGCLGLANFGLDLDMALGVFVRTGRQENGQYEYRLIDDDSGPGCGN